MSDESLALTRFIKGPKIEEEREVGGVAFFLPKCGVTTPTRDSTC